VWIYRVAAPAGLMFAAFAAAMTLSAPVLLHYDPDIARQVAHSMVTEGTFLVRDDAFGLNKPYASYAFGMTLLMVIPEIVGPLIGRPPTNLDTLINPVLLAIIALITWLTARRFGCATRVQAAVVTFAVVFATPLLAYSATAFSEIAVALGIAAAILGLLRIRDDVWAGGLLVGAGAGIAGLFRTDSFLLVAPIVAIGGLVAARRRFPALVTMAAGFAPGVILTGYYNVARFGSPFVFQYQNFPLVKSFGAPFWQGLYGLLASPGRGIFFYAPVLLLVLIGFKWAWRRSQVITIVCLVLIVDRFLFYASWWAWHGGGGWGPRFLVPFMAALTPFAAVIVARLSKPGAAGRRFTRPGVAAPAGPAKSRAAGDRRAPAGSATPAPAGPSKSRAGGRRLASAGFATLVLASLSIQVVGASTATVDEMHAEVGRRQDLAPPARPDEGFVEHMLAPELLEATAGPFLEWSFFPIPSHVEDVVAGENLLSRYFWPDRRPRRLLVVIGLVLIALALSFTAARRLDRIRPAIPDTRSGGGDDARAAPASDDHQAQRHDTPSSLTVTS
jgi:hypothetical protein